MHEAGAPPAHIELAYTLADAIGIILETRAKSWFYKY